MSRFTCSMYLVLMVSSGLYGPSTVLHAAECVVDGETIGQAKNEYSNYCSDPRADCDQIEGKWFCSSANISQDSVLNGEINLADLVSLSKDLYGQSTDPHAAECVVDGETISQAKNEYSNYCLYPRVDCDQIEGRWFCSSAHINHDSVLNGEINLANSAPLAHAENLASDLVVGDVNDLDTGDFNIEAVRCVDTDSDGWGWNGKASCRVGTESDSLINTVQAVLPSDDNAGCAGPYTANDITDLLLVTGQSNVIGAETAVSATLDRWGRVTEFHSPDKPHPRVFAWTVTPQSNNLGLGWQVASLDQTWHDSAPGIGGIARNNFAFHFAKHVVTSEECRVVGFIMVSEGGKGISHWDYNATGWNEVVLHVTQALAAIGRSGLDGILWHQGESDWIVDGTCFNVPSCQNNQPDYYAQKLYSNIADQSIPNPVASNALIDRLRRESWFGAGKPFIAGKTVKAPVNLHLNKLNTDNDQWTACVDSDLQAGLGIREDDLFQNHYNAEGLRALGVLYANEYLQMTR